MTLLNKSLLAIAAPRLKKLDEARRRPEESQQELFKELLACGEETAIGKQYAFHNIRTVSKFQEQVPLCEYEGMLPYIERIRKGERNVLWNTPVRWFAKSSGTTSQKSKYIPITKESLHGCHFAGAKSVLYTYLRNNPRTGIFGGKALTLGGSQQLDKEGSGVYRGDLSAILISNSPWYSELVRTPKPATALIPDFETKVRRIADETIGQNVTNFSGVPSWNLVLMRKILDISGKKNLLEIWPNMELFMHGGVSFTPYREQYRQLIPSDDMHYMETYNASEGFFAMQDDPSDSGMLLIPDIGVFYEFLPMSRFEEAMAGNYTAFDTMATVRTGVNYALVISTNGGLWRYMIGDTVMFTSLRPHKIKITGRTRHYINAFGEELIMENALAALHEACNKTGARISNYTVAPVFMDDTAKGAHEWVVEFEARPSDVEQFADILDAALCEVNSDYEAKRSKNTTLNRLCLTEVPQGTFYEWMKQRGKLGGQNKVPQLYNTREYVDELLKVKIN